MRSEHDLVLRGIFIVKNMEHLTKQTQLSPNTEKRKILQMVNW